MSETPAQKFHEVHEQVETVHTDMTLSPVSLTMAILAVLVAATSLMSHRAHNEVLLAQLEANFQKGELVGIQTQQHADAILVGLIDAMNPANPAKAQVLREKYDRDVKLFASEQAAVKAKEKDREHESLRYRLKADRLDIGELFCELALVLCSITLLTRQRPFWYAGMAAGTAGLIVSLTSFLAG